jgi:hypothetical protein
MVSDPDFGTVASFGDKTARIVVEGMVCPPAQTMMVWIKRAAVLTGTTTLLGFGVYRPWVALGEHGEPVTQCYRRGTTTTPEGAPLPADQIPPNSTTTLRSRKIPAEWTHVAWTADANGSALYLNGVRVSQGVAVELTGVGLWIGNYKASNGGPGLLAEVRVFDQVLSPEAIYRHMIESNPTLLAAEEAGADPAPIVHLPLRTDFADTSGRGHSVAATRMSLVDDANYGTCAGFETGAKLTISAILCPARYTMMVWAKRDPNAASAGTRTILEYGDNEPLLGLLDGSKPYFQAPSRGDLLTRTILQGPQIGDEWTHLAVTVDATASVLYVDGERVAQGPSAASGGVGLGVGYNRGDAYFEGKLAEVQVFDRALSADAVRAHMTATKPPPAATPAPPPASIPAAAVPAAPPVYVHNVVVPEFTRWDQATLDFYKTYGDDYDFLIIVSPPIEGLNPMYSPVRRELCPGLGHTRANKNAPVRNGEGLGSAARLKGTIWVPLLGEGYGPPTSNHEILHYWGTYLTSQWEGFITGMAGHWGVASTAGSHGGFDVRSLRDEAGQPIEDPLSVQPGSVVRVAEFDVGASSISTPYSPIELFMMGLVDKEEIPQDIYVMKSPQYVRSEPAPLNEDPYDDTFVPNTMVFKVDGFTRVKLDELLALNAGGPPRATQTAFRAAWILVTSAPATAAQMAKVEWYAKLSGHVIEDRPTIRQRIADHEVRSRAAGTWLEGGWVDPRNFPPRARYLSFEEATGGRATLDTRLTPKTTT